MSIGHDPGPDTSHLSPEQMNRRGGTAGLRRCDLTSHAATCRACLLALSDERNAALRARLDAFRAGYAAALNDMASAIGGRILPARPTEIEKLRYPPAGRAGWLLPRRGAA